MVAVVGCGRVDDGLSNLNATCDPIYIGFSGSSTKASSNDIDSMEGDSDGFVVYGLQAGSSEWSEHLDGNRYIYDSIQQSWGWLGSDIPWWPEPFSTMNFYAYYPSLAAGFSLSATAPNSIVAEIVVQESILNQTDFLASHSGDVTLKPLTGMQPMSFKHITSKVSFSVLQQQDVLTVIRQLGIENIIGQGSYDYINQQWSELSSSNLASYDDYVGSSGVFAKYGVEDQVDPIRIDGHYLMLIPQSAGDKEGHAPTWDGSITLDQDGDLLPEGAYISIRYRTNDATEDIVGYAFRQDARSDTEWDERSYYYGVYKSGGSYTGPLYVKAGFKISPDQLNWQEGIGYDYILPLTQSGGIYLSEYYYDVDGTNTKIPVCGNPKIGDSVYAADISGAVTVSGWK